MTTANPLLLCLFDAHDSEGISESDLLHCLDLIISFSVRRAACNVPSNSYNKIFLQWVRNFTSDRVVDWLTEQMMAGVGTRRWPTDEEFRLALLTQPQYGKKSTRQLLVALEESHEHKERVDLANATIEHVLPQTLNEIWRQEL